MFARKPTSVAAAFAVALVPALAQAAGTADPNGAVGATSYQTLPFQSQVYAPCWMCSPGLEPGQLFFNLNPASPFNNTTTMSGARRAAAAQTAKGIIPSGASQRWEDTYEISLPPSDFGTEPPWVLTDRKAGYSNMPDYAGWATFVQSHPQYWDVAFDGGTMPSEAAQMRSYGSQWGFISPLTPLDAADCPTTVPTCTWGDVWAHRWSATSLRSGGYGITMSDFSDSNPGRPSNFHDFNPRIIAAFAKQYELNIVGATPAAQAKWIVANAFNQWNDFLSDGYGAFYNALAVDMSGATGIQALIEGGCGLTPATRRLVGGDLRRFAMKMNVKNFLCIWDDHFIQSDRAGPIAAPPMQELGGFIVAAAREPLVRNGAILEADDAVYWAAINQFYPKLSAADQKEVGYKLLKRLWLWSSWAHIADRSGNIRRALAFVARDYWDSGSIAALDPMTSLIQTIVPTRPFGPAFYYPVSVERAVEAADGKLTGVGVGLGYYLLQSHFQAFADAGGGFGYYVTDAALPKIVKGSANAPSAWIVIDANGLMPAAEAAQLTAIAPIVTTPAALAALPKQPLAFSGGLTGFGFYDQSGRLIVVVSNPSTQPTATPTTANITISGLANGAHAITDLFAGGTFSTTSAAGTAAIPLTVARWDTMVLAITP